MTKKDNFQKHYPKRVTFMIVEKQAYYFFKNCNIDRTVAFYNFAKE